MHTKHELCKAASQLQSTITYAVYVRDALRRTRGRVFIK